MYRKHSKVYNAKQLILKLKFFFQGRKFQVWIPKLNDIKIMRHITTKVQYNLETESQ